MSDEIAQGAARMRIFGKSISDYVKFEWGFLTLVLVVGLARLAMSLLDVPNSTTKYVSLTVLLLFGLIYFPIRVYTSGFGSYKQLLPAIALPVIAANCIIIAGIAISILTAKNNIFSAPEYSGGGDGKTWGHAAGHFVVMFVGSLALWLIGCLIMFVTKKITGAPVPRDGTAA